MIYREIHEAAGDAAACEALFDRNGSWRFCCDGIYPFQHFHSSAHEVLGVVLGRAAVVLDGRLDGKRFELAAAMWRSCWPGTAHFNKRASVDFLLAGGYLRGQDWDLRRGHPAEHDEVVENMKRYLWPENDPERTGRWPSYGHDLPDVK